MKTDKKIEVHHINPNCKDSRFCNPHSERGEVTYDYDRFMEWHNTEVQKAVEEAVRGFYEVLKKHCRITAEGGGGHKALEPETVLNRYLKDK